MDDNKKLALEMAKSFIQNSNVKPLSGEEGIEYLFDNTIFPFSTIVDHFLTNIEIINDWE
ncbi:hypothetical protein MUO14_08335 [Halobacillus shinanisalinarum]|uniref:Uncharacterized protein n=1 Tax=Halobacillus shinanisalinarum TaxID=2932258 RepID=A0ABY4H466_9BACI|nr:hypothetical protein [Halobacillus shinanisalinarum]UOQ94919.1 hypothetical protein MUO14_08335 [Halobacillus shinanisalinarum]